MIHFTLSDLSSAATQQSLRANFEAYLDGFSPDVQDILDKFQFRQQIGRLSDADALGTLITRFLSPDINLSPEPVLNHAASERLRAWTTMRWQRQGISSMNIESVRASLASRLTAGFDFYERRPGKHQLIIPIHHEDGDMVDIYITESPKGDGWARICDFGMALMRLSYTYDINTDAKRRIFDSILINNGVDNDDGSLYLDARTDALYEGVMQFAGCVQKVCNMRFWSREAVRSAFYDDLKTYILSDLERLSPTPDFAPIQNSPVSVDWALSRNSHSFYVFGVQNNMKARDVTIALLECRSARLPFISLVVHENMEEIGRKESYYLTKHADRQYPALGDFRESASADIDRFAGAAQARG